MYAELEIFSADLAKRERWLALNKIDLIAPELREQRCQELIEALSWKAPVFRISAISGEGCRELMEALMGRIERSHGKSPADVSYAIR